MTDIAAIGPSGGIYVWSNDDRALVVSVPRGDEDTVIEFLKRVKARRETTNA